MAKGTAAFKGDKELNRKIRKMISGPRKGSARIGTNVEYGIYQELGTSKMAAQSFLRPAYDQERGHALEEISAVLKDTLLDGPRVDLALHAGGLVIETSAKIKAPIESGALRSSITTEVKV